MPLVFKIKDITIKDITMLDSNKIIIVIGIGSYNDIGLIRSCGENNFKVIYITTPDDHPIKINKSKYVIETYFFEFSEKNILSKIFEVSNRFTNKNFYIFPASDNIVEILDKNYDKLPANIITSHAKGKVNDLMDKTLMAEMAKNAGLSVPSTISITSNNLNQLSKYLENIPFPIIVKPVKSINGNKSDIKIFQNESNLFQYLQFLFSQGYNEVLLQEYIHNKSSKEIGITGIAYENGNIEFYGWIEKYRNRFNINNFGKYIPRIDIECKNQLKRYIKETGYRGIFDTDFILMNDKLYFIECNFRNGAYGYAVTKAGFNMPVNWIRSNNNSKKTGKLKTITFMEERTDILNVLDGSVSSIKWVKDLFRTNSFLWWNWKDPIPLIRIPSFIKNKLSKCFK